MELPSPETHSEYKASVDEKGNVTLKKKANIKRGKKSKSKGGQFEIRVRQDLEQKGYVVDKWSNNIDLEEGKIIPAKRKFNPFNKVMTIGTGFPDFIAIQQLTKNTYEVIGIEVKTNGTLNKKEKEKCKWLLQNNIFSNILIAKKTKEKNRIKIIYEEAKNIIKRMKE
jgi:hypothetical protein